MKKRLQDHAKRRAIPQSLRCHASVKSYRRQVLQVTENKEKCFGTCQADIAKKVVTG